VDTSVCLSSRSAQETASCFNHFYRWEELEAAIEVGSVERLWGELPETVRLAEEC